MNDDKKAEKTAEDKKEKEKNKEKKPRRGGKSPMIMIFLVITGGIFLPTAALLSVGMLPTFVAIFVDRHPRKMLAVTVACLNFAGCSPYLFDLWIKGHYLDDALLTIMNPQAIILMYGAAGVGYMLDWALSGLVAGVLYQRGLARQKTIIERQQELAERWGREVTGEIPLDPNGFPLEAQPPRR